MESRPSLDVQLKGYLCRVTPRACLITLSLDTVEDVMVGEVDELEEDVG